MLAKKKKKRRKKKEALKSSPTRTLPTTEATMQPYAETTPTDDDSYDATDIMAQTMGFSAFGGAPHRPSKRRRMDDAVVALPEGRGHGSAANSTPLGSRQQPQQQLPPPSAVQAVPVAHNAEELDLDLDDDDHSAAAPAAPVDGDGVHSAPADAAADSAASNRAPRVMAFHDTGGPPGRATQGREWYVDYYDRKSNQNPWQKLEERLGLQPRSSWPSHKNLQQSVGDHTNGDRPFVKNGNDEVA